METNDSTQCLSSNRKKARVPVRDKWYQGPDRWKGTCIRENFAGFDASTQLALHRALAGQVVVLWEGQEKKVLFFQLC